MPLAKDIPSTPYLVKTLQHGRNIEVVNLNLFDHMFMCRLGIDNEFNPNAVLDLRLMPLLMVEHFVIALNPNGPKCDPSKKVSSFDIFAYFLGIFSPMMACFS